MRYSICLLGLLVCWGQIIPSSGVAAGHSIGGGAYYQKTLGDIKDSDEFDEDAISWMACYQLELNKLVKIEADLEIAPDYGGSDEILYQPQGYVLLGTWIYAGAGIGIGYLDGEWNDDPFYAFRAGLDLPLGERIHLDINANYRFMDASVLDDIDEEDADAITFGALLRFGL